MSNYSDDTFLARWLSGELTEAEQKEFEQSEDYRELSRLLKGTEMLQSPGFEGDVLLSRIKAQTNNVEGEVSAKKKVRPLVYLGITAAVMAAAIGLLLFLFRPTVDYFDLPDFQELTTAQGEIKTQLLPDSSLFRLNENSKLVYIKNSYAMIRELSLEGEAYFEVKKGESFSVNTNLGSVSVLGTRFNVSSRGGVLKVACFEGKVELKNKDASLKKVLTAGDQAILKAEILEEETFEVVEQAYPNWLNEIYSEQDISIKKSIAAFEQIYGVEIEVENVDVEEIVSISFLKNDLEKAIVQFTKGFQANYEILSPYKIRIYR